MNPNKHEGKISSLNLCVESSSNFSADKYAHTCSLMSVVVGRMESKEHIVKTARTATRILANTLSLTKSPVDIADKLPDPIDVFEKRLTKMEPVETDVVFTFVVNALHELRSLYNEKKIDEVKVNEYLNNLFGFYMDNEDVFNVEFVTTTINYAVKYFKLPIKHEIKSNVAKAISKYKMVMNEMSTTGSSLTRS